MEPVGEERMPLYRAKLGLCWRFSFLGWFGSVPFRAGPYCSLSIAPDLAVMHRERWGGFLGCKEWFLPKGQGFTVRVVSSNN